MANNYPTIRPSLNMNFAGMGVLPPDVTFTRASQSGGYYDGRTVVKAEENLLIRSADLTQTAHFKSGVTASSATQIQAAATTAEHFVHYNTATAGLLPGSGTVTQTIRMSAGTYDLIQIFAANDAGLGIANIDLTAGTIGTNTLGVTVTSVGAGVYDIKCTYTTSGTNRVLGVALVTSTSAARQQSWTALGTETVNILFQQYEQRSFATAYTPTTTAPITNYIPKMLFAPANVPVFDHNPVTGEALGLSVWEARTNLVVRSQEFDDAAWTKSNSTITANTHIAPDGTLTADTMAATAANANINRITGGVLNGTTYTFSLCVKKGTSDTIRLDFGNVATGPVFTFSTATMSSVGSWTSAVQDIGNGWYRISASRASNTTTAGMNIVIPTSGETVIIWGAQWEAGSFATPYIPTVASTVARSADRAVMTGVNFSRWYRADEGTLVAKYVTGPGRNDACVFAIDDGSVANRISLLTDISAGTDGAVFAVSVGASAQAFLTNGTPGLNEAGAFSGAYKVNDFASYRDGSTIQTDTAGTVPVVSLASIGSTGVPTAIMNGYIKSIQYYPTRLTNAQLQAVTA